MPTLKCGLEIHQQLDTGKLFCNCPSVIREDEPDYTVTRSLRASAGETGEVDAAAKHEQAKAKRFRYHGYRGTTCLVELDEEPPRPPNPAAVKAAIQTAKLLGSHVLDELHVMRKTVVDGSNTSGFQRTGLVALGGELNGVRIQTVCLEEDSAKIVSRAAAEDAYNLSRLGIPLIEIATDPDITTPAQAKEVAAAIGMIVRSTGAAKRGLGTIRQDLNVSVPGGARVEIKGAQDLKLLPTLIENEAKRQEGLLAIRTRIKKFLLPAPHNLTPFLAKTTCGFISKGIKDGLHVIGVALPGMRGLPGTELYPGYRLGTELAGYAQAFGYGGLIHGDEDPEKYTFTAEEADAIRKRLGVKKDDSYLLLLGPEQKTHDLLAFVLAPRLEQLRHGVPQEVRRANPDGSSTYLRPMPGAARMYPETDLRPQPLDTGVKAPKLLAEQEAALAKKHGVPVPHAKELLRHGWDLDAYAKRYPKLTPSFLAQTLLDAPKEIKRRHGKELDLIEKEGELTDILANANDGTIPKEAVFELLVAVAENKKPDYGKYAAADHAEVEKIVRAVIEADPGAPINALMGQAMAKLRGKADGKTVMALLKKLT